MWFFSKKKREARVALVCDIGSASVGVALVYTDTREKQPRVLYQTRTDIAFQKELDFPRFLTDVDTALNDALARVVSEGMTRLSSHPHKSVDHVLCVLSSPWHTPYTKTVHTTFEKETEITKEHLTAILRHEEETFRNEKPEEAPGTRVTIERIITGSVLNGYTMTDPVGKHASNLGVSLFISVSSELLLNRLRDIITQHVHPTREIIFHSFSLVSATVVRDLFPNKNDFLMVDVTGEVTDITLVIDDIPEGVASFPLGARTFLRGIAKELDANPDEARSALHLYAEKKATSKSALKVESALFAYGEKWQKGFREALTALAQQNALPADVFLSTDTDMQTTFADFIRAEHGSQILLSDATFRVTPLSAALFVNSISIPKESEVRDVFLLLETFFLAERLREVNTNHSPSTHGVVI